MFDKKPYIKELLRIKEDVPMSLIEMSKEIGIQYNTLKTFLDVNDNNVVRNPTIRKIKAFINKHKN